MPKRKVNNLAMLTVGIAPTMLSALERMAEDSMRSVPNLVRKILLDHLRNGRYLSEDEERAVRLENVCILRRPKAGL